jgi:6-phosphogluconolactonase
MIFRRLIALLTLTLVPGVLHVTASTAPAGDEIFVFLGTYTSGESEGIYVATLDRENGTLSKPTLAAKVDNPGFVALHPTLPRLYSVSEVREPAGSVTAFAIDPKTGMLSELNKQTAGGAGPCHLAIDPSGKVIAVANYGGGSICSIPVAEDGSLRDVATFVQHEGSSTDKRRQEGPHAHSANFDAAGEFVVVCDLGLDKLMVYKVNRDTGELTANDPPSTSVAGGSGPRHLSFHPSGKFAYACLEMSSEVRAFLYHPEEGVFYGIETYSTLPESFTVNNSTAEVLVHPNGKFVYVSNRGHDSIAIFEIDQDTGKLTPAGHASTHGQTPRNFGIDPSGQYLLAANQQTNNVIVFRVNDETGQLSETGSSISVPNPICVRYWKP